MGVMHEDKINICQKWKSIDPEVYLIMTGKMS